MKQNLLSYTHQNHRWEKCCFCLVTHDINCQMIHDIPWHSSSQQPRSARVAVWMCDIMESISAEMLHFSFNVFQSIICYSAGANLSVYLKSHVRNENPNSRRCLLPCRVRTSYVPLPLVVSMHFLFFFKLLLWFEIKLQRLFSSPLSLNTLPRLSFQPVFSLGSLPGKQEKHLNQWKMCLMVLGSTAPLCSNSAKV